MKTEGRRVRGEHEFRRAVGSVMRYWAWQHTSWRVPISRCPAGPCAP